MVCWSCKSPQSPLKGKSEDRIRSVRGVLRYFALRMEQSRSSLPNICNSDHADLPVLINAIVEESELAIPLRNKGTQTTYQHRLPQVRQDGR